MHLRTSSVVEHRVECTNTSRAAVGDEQEDARRAHAEKIMMKVEHERAVELLKAEVAQLRAREKYLEEQRSNAPEVDESEMQTLLLELEEKEKHIEALQKQLKRAGKKPKLVRHERLLEPLPCVRLLGRLSARRRLRMMAKRFLVLL